MTSTSETKLSLNLDPDNVKLDIPPIGVFSSTELDITTNGEYYEGYNLFVLDKQNAITHLQEVHLIVIDMEGNVISSRFLGSSQALIYSIAKFINSTTIVVGGILRPFLWNFFDNTTKDLRFSEHHDIEYISETNTFLTLQREQKVIDGIPYAFDKIIEYTMMGEAIWSVSSQSFVSHTQWCPYQDMSGDARSITHANSLFYNPDDDTILLGLRDLNTIYKINHTSKELIWSLGENGEFDLYDLKGNPKDSLWYHSHAFEFFDDNKIILFDNDFHNQTDINSKYTRIVEIVIDEENKIANETWTYEAPVEYYSGIWGDADKLPNGNRLGTFGSMIHTFESRNAKVLEINEEGEIVWKMDFVENDIYTYGIYRTERFLPYPGIDDTEDIYSNSIEDTTLQLDTWSGYRTRTDLEGYYRIYLNESLVDEGPHIYRSYWRKSALDINLGKLAEGNYNLTIVLEDDYGHEAIRTMNVEVKPFYVIRTGFTEIELGQTESTLKWEGKAETPLQLNLTVNDSIYNTTSWVSTNVSIDLNTLGIGSHKIEFLLYNSTELVYNETFYAHVYPAEPPEVTTGSVSLSRTWGDAGYIQWDISDNTPKQWEIWVDGNLYELQDWTVKIYELNWKIPSFNEGLYNITLILYDHADFTASSTVMLTITPPSPPVLLYVYSVQEYQFGVGNITASWSIHGGSFWYLWLDDAVYTQGAISDPLFTFSTNDWDVSIWGPGQHNVTLQVVDDSFYETSSSIYVVVWLNKADPYADAIVASLSDVYLEGENALGAPDNESCRLIETYTHGFITLDMGEQEEVLNHNGDDFQVYTSGGEYQIWIGNDVESPFTYLGSGTGNSSFNIDSVSFSSVRYIKVQYTLGDYLDLDAIEAFYYNEPEWDSYPPVVQHLMGIEAKKTDEFAVLIWVAFDSNPFNYSIHVDGLLFQLGDWNGSIINSTIPLTRTGEILVELTLFDAFGNSAFTWVRINVIDNTTLALILNITLPSIIVISGAAIFTTRFLKFKKKGKK
ncbi:MAG: aryl-sulfate sulfotransferase [Candidatus Heimdallarchaeaceae archaeon]